MDNCPLQAEGNTRQVHRTQPGVPCSLSTLAKGNNLKPGHRRSETRTRTCSPRYTLGGELVEITPPPPVEPTSLIRPDLTIPLVQRICSNPKCMDDTGCPTSLVACASDGSPVIVESGICPKCKRPFSFEQLTTGTLVSSQYEIKGPVAVGGCGFVYLAWDVNVGQYVILKGLINSEDPVAAAAAIRERQFLADLRDPSIVSIINFVTHKNRSYIVEEFINGSSLDQLRRKNHQPFTVPEAISYTLAMLPSFEYLHSRQPPVIFCDGKLNNFILQGNRVRMIDLGGARRENDFTTEIYMTPGFCAPEAYNLPTVLSDLYTVGRCLAVMLADFDFLETYVNSLPSADEEPLFAENESLYRFLLRATATDPNDRFQSAIEMGQQLWGILKETVALQTGHPVPAESSLFSIDLSHEKNKLDFHLLPRLRVNKDDPAHHMIESGLILNDLWRQKEIFKQAAVRFPDSMEAPMRVANCLIETGKLDRAAEELQRLYERDPYDWRVAWLTGKQLLAKGEPSQACAYFDAVYTEIPGELAPKLALAVSSEMSGDLDTAIKFYDLVSRVDPGYTSASFGLARCLSKIEDKKGAVAAYSRVPQDSISYTQAVEGRVKMLLYPEPLPGKDEFLQAAEALRTIAMDNYAALKLQADLMLAALSQIEEGLLESNKYVRLLNVPLMEAELRNNLESTLRQCAQFAPTESERIDLIDKANKIRCLTWL